MKKNLGHFSILMVFVLTLWRVRNFMLAHATAVKSCYPCAQQKLDSVLTFQHFFTLAKIYPNMSWILNSPIYQIILQSLLFSLFKTCGILINFRQCWNLITITTLVKISAGSLCSLDFLKKNLPFINNFPHKSEIVRRYDSYVHDKLGSLLNE